MGGELDPTGVGAWDEIWQCTINLNSFSSVDADAWLSGGQSAIKTWFTGSSAKMSALSRIHWLKLNKINAAGEYDDPTTSHTYNYATPGVGYVTGSYWTIDQCVVWSWTTALSRGPGHMGRIYPPNAGAAVAGGAQVIDSTAQSQHITAAKGLLSVLSATYSGVTMFPVVATKINATNPPITGVRVGRVIDTQRRRRNKVSESYASAVWP